MARKLKRKLKNSYKKPERKVKKLRKRYESKKCQFILGNGKRCNNYCTGKGTLCRLHGGERIIKENLLKNDEIPLGLLKNVKYDPVVHPIQYIDLSRSGMSKTEIAGIFEVSVATINNWSETFEEFYQAMEIGKALHETWYLLQGKNNLANPRFNVGLFKFLTANKLGYAEKIESKNINMNAHGVLMIPNKQTEDEWAANAQKVINNDDGKVENG
jgi:hypothetical protein